MRAGTWTTVVAAAGLLACAPAGSGSIAESVQQQKAPPTLDLGSSDPTQVVTVSLIFRVTAPDGLEAYVAATQDPGSPDYHRFLSVHDFAGQFAPGDAAIHQVSAYLQGFGIQVGATLADHLALSATGTVGAFTQAFTFDMHDYQNGGRRYHRPQRPPQIPLALADTLLVVTGFSSQPLFHPMNRRADAVARMTAPKAVLPANGTATGVPGSYTVGDFANLYDVNPLYHAGLDGTGSTIGVATLANFDPADAYTYWDLIGLPVAPNRIRQIHVDGGGDLSAEAGSDETALDVEQSGGVAPGARVVVYDAPNTDGGFIDLFYNAASDNLVDSLSVSWGGPEVFYFNSDLTGGDFTAEMVAFHQVFLEGAAQGISLFASAGDSGAYDETGTIPGYTFSHTLTVDVPASDPAITAAGGTTTPVSLSAGPGTPTLVVSQEQVWGWDYLQNYLVQVFGPVYQGALFSEGGGGGVSSYWAAPDYQAGFPGVRRTEAGQTLTINDGQTTDTLLTLPANFHGRNLPDVSANADPYSGYLIYSTPLGGLIAGYGGTSFVGPQLSGVTALARQSLGGRLGLWNPMLYRFARARQGAAITDVTGGDNWFYDGVAGYEPGAGLGVLDVANFSAAVAREAHPPCAVR